MAKAAKAPPLPARGAREVPEGFVRLRHPEWIGCVWRGEAYMPREDRTVIVPAEAVEELRAHGFRPVE